MKNIFSIILFGLLLAGCGSNSVEEMTWPESLEDKKALLKEKRNTLAEAEKDIARLEEEIATLQPDAERQKRLITTQKVMRGDFKHFVELQGTVQSDEIVNVSSEVPGRLLQLAVEEGQNVNRGQLIGKIDLEQVDKQIAELEKSIELAKEVYDRQKRLWYQNIGSEIQYLQAKNNKERLEKSLETIRYQKTKSNIYAPISGVVEMVNLKAGEMASPGLPIVTLLNTSKVKVVAEVPETYLTSVKKGEQVGIKFPALNKEEQARISLIGKTINPANRTFNVEVNMNNTSGLLKPNLLALMLLNDHVEKNAVTIPLEVVQQESGGKFFVFVKEGEVAKKVYITTGKSYEGNIVVQEGLKGGEELIIEGARSVSDNEPVILAKNE